MRHFAHFCRLLPLAAAALASVATSALHTSVQIEAASPGPDESAVAADAVITVRVSTADGDPPSALYLRTKAQQDVAGHAERHKDANGDLVYTFTPDAPLAPDDYRLFFASGDTVVDASYADPDLDALYASYSGDVNDSTSIVQFTTVSRPAVRYLAHPDAPLFIVSFSEAMDEDSLAAVHVVDSAGVIVPAATIWHPDAHSYEMQAAPGLGAYKVRFDEGIVAASGVPLPGLPFTMAPTRP